MTKPVLKLPANTKGRDFVVGDIHGIFSVLDRALASVNFDPARDRLISVGDLIDRGPESDKVLDYLAQPWFHAIRGNHEEMFLYCMRDGTLDRKTAEANIPNGFAWMLETSEEKLLQIALAFLKLPRALEIAGASGKPEDRIAFVHADVPPGMSWDTFTRELDAGTRNIIKTAQWSRERIDNRDTSGVAGVARLYMGHTPKPGATQLGNCFYIDTGGVFRLTNGDRGAPYFLLVTETLAPAAAILARPQPGRDYLVAQNTPRPPAAKPQAPKPPGF